MNPTPEQLEIVNFAKIRRENLIISALAGAAKTTTLELICKELTGTPILSLAFNKRIADEMARRLPNHVKAQTMNSLGHRAWGQFTGRRLTLNTRKSYDILRSIIDDLSRPEKIEAREVFSEVLQAIRVAKITGYIPKDKFSNIEPLTNEDPFEDEPSDIASFLLDKVLTNSIKAAFNGTIDFDDQIYMPVLFGGVWPKFPLVMVDEVQDLNPINHKMLEKLVTSRIIAVGDPWQSIYGFRGAIQNGMNKLRKQYSMEEKSLSVSFRCPQAVVRRAWFRVPHMKWPEWAEEGYVESLSSWSVDSIPDSAAIICRNNAPLFSLAIRLIRAGRNSKLVGSDIGPNLIKILRKFGPENMMQEQLYAAIDQYEATTKTRNPGALADRCECLRVFAAAGPTLGFAVAYAERLFASDGPIQLLSGHKAKGLEWDTVYHLDPWRIPSKFAETDEDKEQEYNIRYVILTRTKREYYEINLNEMQ